MHTKKTSLVDQLRGATKLAIDATRNVTEIVEKMHHTIGGGPEVLGKPLEKVTRLFSAPTYATIRGVTKLVGAGLDLALQQLEPLLERAGSERGLVLAALNGVMGDYLEETGNPLAIQMQLRVAAAAVTSPFPAGTRLLVLVHGSSMEDLQWLRKGHDHGPALAKALGFVPVYLRYNSGLHVSENGRRFSALLEAWASEVDEVVLLAHSMGGLVSRAACHTAEEAGHGWRKKLTTLITLGTPHHGAPLERGGNWVDVLLGVSRYSAPLAKLGQLRSAGVTDLRYGNVLDAHWEGRDRFARGGDPRGELSLPAGVGCYAIAASLGGGRGDGLVPVDSALGVHAERSLGFPEAHRWTVSPASHLDLLDHPEVFAKLLEWLTGASVR
ncbi:MAG: alpha/beta hydrolase [Archangium sp.]|nr:alpha/beta hydrolase [Archangium sp.]MDP3153270.1 alpha/beta hydrolase [Archangium sp.]MDP3569640.1 alpha/beta hydrolase [Archangium sp.]